MISVNTSSSGSNGIAALVKKYEKTEIPIGKISKVVQEDIKEETKRRGWKRIEATIKRKVIDRNTHEIFIGGKKKDAEISRYLNSGTKRHFVKPKKKKALHWTSEGQNFFSKGHWVSGITPGKFIDIYPNTRKKIDKIIKDTYK